MAAGVTGQTSWRIAGQRAITLGGRIVSMSPNGRWLAALPASNVICLYAVTTLQRAQCGTLSHGDIFNISVVWSPDSTRLAFTENWAQYYENSDIWVMDVASGALRDLTPDGGPRNITLPPKPNASRVLVDAAPAWSPDGKALIFARTVLGQRSTSLYRIPVGGGTPVRLAVIAADQAYALYFGLCWLPDGRILYSPDIPNPNDPRNGLWLLGADGGTPRELLKPDPKLGMLLLMQVTPDMRTALVWYYNFASQFAVPPNTSTFALVNLATGARQQIMPSVGAKERFLGPNNATFSPDGARVFYIYRTLDGQQPRLALRPTRGGPESLLRYDTRGPYMIGLTDLGLGLNWASNDTIYVSTAPNQGVLLTLKRS